MVLPLHFAIWELAVNCRGAFLLLVLLIHPLSKEPDSTLWLPGVMERPVLCWGGHMISVCADIPATSYQSIKGSPSSPAHGLMLMLLLAPLSYLSAGQVS